jgi:hypothetical protein
VGFLIAMLAMCLALGLEDRGRAIGASALVPDTTLVFLVLFGLHCQLGARIVLITMLAVLRATLSGEPFGRDLFLMLLAGEGLALIRRFVFVANFTTLLFLSFATAVWLGLGRAFFRWLFDAGPVPFLRLAAPAALAILITPLFVRAVVRMRVFGSAVERWS